MSEVPHIITAAPFTPVNMEPVFVRAEELRELDQDPAGRRENAQKFVGSRAVNLFYQESTRTRGSFEMAEVAWGMGYTSTANARAFSSAAKGETLEHTTEVMSAYGADMIVLRYDKEGGAADAARVSEVPVINAGDGKGEHPTQAFLDAYTIWEQQGRLDSLRLTFMGDLRYGRTVRSLLHVMTKEPTNRFNFISDPNLSLPDDIKIILDDAQIAYQEHTSTNDIENLLYDTDVLYVTRTQKNLGAPKVEGKDFRVTKKLADVLPEGSIILHPMPIDRSDIDQSEIAPEVDTHPRAKYIRQAGNGLYVRMALIERLLEGKPILAETA